MSNSIKKYILTEETAPNNSQLRRIKRVSDGELGGFIEKEENLSHEGDCWVYGNAWVFGRMIIKTDIEISSNSNLMEFILPKWNITIFRPSYFCKNNKVIDRKELKQLLSEEGISLRLEDGQIDKPISRFRAIAKEL